MALDSTAKRFSAAGIPYPGVGFDKRNRAALALVTRPTPSEGISATLGEFTTDFDGTFAVLSLSFNAKQRASVYGMGWPGIDADVRSGLAAIPSNQSVGEERLGLELDSFTVAFLGEFTGTERDGAVALTLGEFSPSFVGEHYYNHFFDITYGIVPTWVAHELPPNAGAIDVTLAGFTASFEGLALPPGAIDGDLAIVVGSFTLDFDGEFTAPASTDGELGLDIEVFGISLQGSAVPPDSALGSFDLTLAEFTGSFAGTFEPPVADGALELTFAEFTVSYRGQFIDAAAVNGRITGILNAFSIGLLGTHVAQDSIIGATASSRDIRMTASSRETGTKRAVS